MKHAPLLATLALLGACAGQPAQPVDVTSRSIQAFRDICLHNAPDFAGSIASAKAYGITETKDLGFMTAGFSADKSMSMQLKPGKECVVTTPEQTDNSLTRQLLSAVAARANSPMPRSVPTRFVLAGQSFIVMHDRRGGEAFVLLKAN